MLAYRACSGTFQPAMCTSSSLDPFKPLSCPLVEVQQAYPVHMQRVGSQPRRFFVEEGSCNALADNVLKKS